MPYSNKEFKESNVSYLNKDFTELKASLLDYAKSYFPDSYRDFNETSPGMMLIEMSAYVGDVMSFYIDQQYKEMMLPLAEERKNIINMAKMFGYKIKPSIPSFVDITFSQLVASSDEDKQYVNYVGAGTFEKGAVLRSDSGIEFETLEKIDFHISGAADTQEIASTDDDGLVEFYRLYRTVKAVSGKRTTKSFVINAPEKFKKITLPETNVIDIISVVDTNGNNWSEVNYLAQDKVPIETHYTDASSNRDSAYLSLTEGDGDATTEISDIAVPYSLEYIRTEKRYITEINEDGTTSLVFGNGVLSGNTIGNNYLQLEQVGITVPGQTTDLVSELDPLLGDEYSTLGEIPSNTTLTVTYRVGGGINSNVPVGSIRRISTMSDNIGGSGTVETNPTNNAPARGGKDIETTEEIRQKASAQFSTQNRCVTKEDYESRILNMSSKYGSISKIYVNRSVAQVDSYTTTYESLQQEVEIFVQSFLPGGTLDTTANNPETTAMQMFTDAFNAATPLIASIGTLPDQLPDTSFGTIDVYILGYDNAKNLVGNPHSSDLGTTDGVTLLMEQNIKNYLSQYKILTDVVNIQDGYIVNFGVEFDIIASKYANKQKVKLQCINAIKNYFNIDKMQFNQPIYLSQLEYILLGIDGVRGINYVRITQDEFSNDAETETYTYVYDNGSISMTTNEDNLNYGYKYDFNDAIVDNVIIPSNPMGTPSVFELKYPNRNIRGRVR